MGQKILIISPTFPYPVTTGNRARIDRLLLNLKQLGHEVHFLYINTEPFDENQLLHDRWDHPPYVVPYRAAYKSFGQRLIRKCKRSLGQESAFLYGIDEWYDSGVDAFLAQLAEQIQFDVVIVEYVFFSKALECFDDRVLKIIDTHDVYTNRHRLYLNNQQIPHWYSTTAIEEAKGLNRADVILAIQQHEQEVFSKLTPQPIVVVGHTVVLHRAPKSRSTQPAVLFFGAENPMNLQGIHEFLQKSWPQIQQRLPDAQLILAGSICNSIAPMDSVIQLGRVEQISEMYALADVVINPIPYGTGLKIKTIEALGYGKPLVTTAIGAEGLESVSNTAFLIADDSNSFAQQIIRVLSDSEFADRLSENAYQFAQQWNADNLSRLAQVLERKV